MANEFDAIIGYDGIKKELSRLADIIRSPEKYKSVGIDVPRGMLLHGQPGTGKTTMANCFIRATGRTSYIFRKVSTNNNFFEEIKSVFEKAKENAPSIILLDDMDKFTESCDDSAEEFSAVQSCIDGLGNVDVFVIATANKVSFLPDSLLRSGRIGRKFHFEFPTGDETIKIIAYYLKGKNVSPDVDPIFVARLLHGRSCAALETILNEAGIIAVHANRTCIIESDIVEAALNSIFSSSDCNLLQSSNLRYRVAYHEAGHVVIAESLRRGSVSICSICSDPHDSNPGFTCVYPEEDAAISKSFEAVEFDLMYSLGGKAATEIVYGIPDVGVANDLEGAFDHAADLVDDFGAYGFDKKILCRYDGNFIYELKATTISTLMEIYYSKVKQILVKNRVLLDAVAEALVEKTTLTYKDIANIENILGDSVHDFKCI